MSEVAVNVFRGCENLRQGDIVGLPEIVVPAGDLGRAERLETVEGVAVVSQTCDVVQDSKRYCLVAPVLENLSDIQKKDAAKGRKPLHLYLDCDDGIARVADLERALSIPKQWLEGRQILARVPGDASHHNARNVSAKIMRAYGRFPFPDEVYPAFRRFRDKVQSDSGRKGNFARVLDLISEVRVSSDQWEKAGRHLKLHLIVQSKLLAHVEDVDPSWEWNQRDVKGARAGESSGTLALNRVSELILQNLDSQAEVLVSLWTRFEESIQHNLLNTHDDVEVFLFDVEVVSEAEMSLEIYKTTESLDLEVLSHSRDS